MRAFHIQAVVIQLLVIENDPTSSCSFNTHRFKIKAIIIITIGLAKKDFKRGYSEPVSIFRKRLLLEEAQAHYQITGT